MRKNSFFNSINKFVAEVTPGKKAAVEIPETWLNNQMVSEMKLVHGIDLDSIETEGDTELPKLLFWFKKHPNAQQCIDFYIYPNQLNQEFHELRQAALKEQINEAISTVMKMESDLGAPCFDSTYSKHEHPFPQLKSLYEASNIWKRICQNDSFSKSIKYILNERNKGKIYNIKFTISHLASLLASADGIPMNYIPCVKFNEINIKTETQEDKIQTTTPALQDKLFIIQKETSDLYQTLLLIIDKYDAKDIEKQIKAFNEMLVSYKADYVDIDNCMKYSTDLNRFLDFFNHPQSVVLQLFLDFKAKKDVESYHKLTDGIVDLFQVWQDSIDYIHALFALAFAPHCLPSIPFDGSGLIDDNFISFGLDFLTVQDPNYLLKHITNNTQLNQEIKGVINTVNTLRCFTSKPELILQYIYDYSFTKSEQDDINAVKNAIGEYLNNKDVIENLD